MPKQHPGIIVLRKLLRKLRWDNQGGYVGYQGKGKWNFISTALPQTTPAELNQLFDLAGVVPDKIVPLGSCKNCVHSINRARARLQGPVQLLRAPQDDQLQTQMTEETPEPKKSLRLPVHPDARKTLAKLRQEWQGCESCGLGVRRNLIGGNFVFGEGIRRGIMFVGEGPGKDEEASGRPFVGRSGRILRGILEKLEFKDYYISNTVACRSCTPMTDAAGNHILSKGYGNRVPEPRYVDQPPTKAEVEACRPRLMEEIYLVDPLVVVALGGGAATVLYDGSFAITSKRGQAVEITVPGAVQSPSLTGKGVWRRKVKGEIVQPMKQNEVQYLMIPTLHPAFVARRANDFSRDNPFQQLFLDIRQAVTIYNRYQLEVFGVVATEPTGEVPYEIMQVDD